MREIAEFRVVEDFALQLFASHEGKRLGDSVRKIMIPVNDPRFARIGELQQKVEATHNRAFFHGWHIHRKYDAVELDRAKLFLMEVYGGLEPAGEECGTVYDETTACPECGAGAAQTSDLHLDFRKAPKSKDIVSTIANEVIVSQRLAERMIEAGLTGLKFGRARHKARYQEDTMDFHQTASGRELLRRAEAAGASLSDPSFWVWINRAENRPLSDAMRAEYVSMKEAEERRRPKSWPVWHQLFVTSPPVDIVAPTRVGVDPFDDDFEGTCRCSRGDLIGLNRLSELSVAAKHLGSSDFHRTRQFVGVRRGLLRPRRLILISPRARELLRSKDIRGSIELEVAHAA